jgi:hypothetical protein
LIDGAPMQDSPRAMSVSDFHQKSIEAAQSLGTLSTKVGTIVTLPKQSLYIIALHIIYDTVMSESVWVYFTGPHENAENFRFVIRPWPN